jgi:hypothetical protein
LRHVNASKKNIMMKAGSLTVAVVVAAVPCLGNSACGVAGGQAESSSHPGLLLSYREEGGIGGPRPSLTVSKQARAKLRLGTCGTGFKLQPPLWRRLRAALESANLPSIAGDYPPPEGSADVITYVVRSDGHEVSIAPAPLPEYETVLAQLEPLLKILGRTVATGKRRLPPGCVSNRSGQAGPGGGSL